MARSARSVNASVAASKVSYPDQFCPAHRCLWRTGGGRCPRHPDPSLPDTRPVDTRPRVAYRMENGAVDIWIIFDHGDEIPETTTYQLITGKIVPVTRVAR
jgi:hypothetical protein